MSVVDYVQMDHVELTPKSPRGICGADADTIVARNFLRAVSAGAACYLHVVENTALNVKHVGENNGVIKSEKLKYIRRRIRNIRRRPT